MKVDFLDIILIVLFFQLLLLIPFLFFNKTNNGISNKLLGLFLLVKALCVTNYLGFRLYDFTYNHFPHAFYFGSSFTILWGPVLFMYVKSLTCNNFRFKRSDIIHIIPFIIHFFILTFMFHIHSADQKREIMDSGGLSEYISGYTFCYMLYPYILFYNLSALYLAMKHNNKRKIDYSSSKVFNLSWLLLVLTGFLLKWVFDFIYLLTDKDYSYSSTILILSRITLLFFLDLMVYKGVKYSFVFMEEQRNQAISKKHSLSESSKDTYLQKLINYMEKEKPFLIPDMSIEELAKLVSIPPRSLSVVINECLNQNFYDFINSYRIKEAERLLLNEFTENKSILEVLYEVGFNSKSSFNMAFKKHKGITPSQFRKLENVRPYLVNE